MTKLGHKKDSEKWHRRYLEMAKLVSTWSKHPLYPVGVVAIGDFGQVLSTGFSGWPRNISGEELAREQAGKNQPPFTIHAEKNVIYNASLTQVSLLGSTVYVYPVFPCKDCALALIQVGVSQICFDRLMLDSQDEELRRKWEGDWVLAGSLFLEAGLTVTELHV